MKIKELRIGNYLHDRNGNLCKVIELREDGIYAHAIRGAITGLPNKPIELTEEWLFKFGFTQDNDSWYFSLDFNPNYETLKIFGLTSGGNFNGMWGIAGMSLLCKKIEYVHQLQNLFYALTGEELTIKS
ncbi:hypothetical protein CMT57_09285 [Elizabethkingia anophelis]|nr:hypothetical protein [Elizabethkingia anophelis]MDV4010020.1 hypothetical protein [Elizabethkingia anophelis]